MVSCKSGVTVPDPYLTQIRNASATLVANASGISKISKGRPYPEASGSANLPKASIFWGPVTGELDGGKDRRHRKQGELMVILYGETNFDASDIDQDTDALSQAAEEAMDTLLEAVEAALDASPTLGLSFVQRAHFSTWDRTASNNGQAQTWTASTTLQITWTYQPA